MTIYKKRTITKTKSSTMMMIYKISHNPMKKNPSKIDIPSISISKIIKKMMAMLIIRILHSPKKITKRRKEICSKIKKMLKRLTVTITRIMNIKSTNAKRTNKTKNTPITKVITISTTKKKKVNFKKSKRNKKS